MDKKLNIQFEKGVRLLAKHFPISKEDSRKPVLFHDIRVGVYLYERGYKADIVLAGLLHDAIEWSDITQEMLRDEFGDNITSLVLASSKDDTIEDKHERINEIIKRCSENGQDALIVKTADIMDSFKWYTSQQNQEQLEYCHLNAQAIIKYKPGEFNDKIFDELKNFLKK